LRCTRFMLTVFYINAGGKHMMHLGVNDPFINLILGTSRVPNEPDRAGQPERTR